MERNINTVCAEKISDYWAHRSVTVTLYTEEHTSNHPIKRVYYTADGKKVRAKSTVTAIGLRSDLRLRAS